MKKSVIALILFAVLIIIVSPGIVGKFAEESVGENLNWAAEESGELVVTTDGFDRGWFSSEGQHRVTLGDGRIRDALASMDTGNEPPVLVINTHIDHGLIPVSSMAREQGSLVPGLGSAVSTLAVEFGDESIELPGTIFSNVGIGGNLDSRYVVEAGSRVLDDGEVTWQPTTIQIVSSAISGDIEFDGDFGAMTFGNDQQTVAIESLTFVGEQSPTPYGFRVGDAEVTMGNMTITSNGLAAGGMQGLNVTATSSVDDGEVKAAGHLEMSGQTIPGFGDVSIIADMAFDSMDAEVLGAVSKRLDELAGADDPAQIMASAEDEFKALFAAGFNLDVDQFDVALPMGTVEAKMSFEFPGSDPATFEWTTLLLDAVAEVDLRIPDALVQLASSMNPQAGAMAGMWLKKEGDVYIMDADFKKGLLTVNGAPIPIPMGAF